MDSELRRLRFGPGAEDEGQLPLLVRVEFRSADPERVVAGARDVLTRVVERIGDWPAFEEWSRLLPAWFVERCVPEEGAEEGAEGWTLSAWLDCFDPDADGPDRSWWWWDAGVDGIEGSERGWVLVDAGGWPFGTGSLSWLIEAGGGAEVEYRAAGSGNGNQNRVEAEAESGAVAGTGSGSGTGTGSATGAADSPSPTTRAVNEVAVIVAHNERATLRVGDVFLKVDGVQRHLDVEVEAMALAPVPTPTVLWRQPSVLALAAVPGMALGRLGEPSKAPPAAWAAAGAAIRALHEAPLPPWPGRNLPDLRTRLEGECEWLLANDVLPAELVIRNRRLAEPALRPWAPAFTHGDLQISHVFIDDRHRLTGIIDWSEAGCDDPLYDLATLTLGHREHLDDLLAGYGPDADVDRDVIRAWWSYRSLVVVRWLVEHGFDPAAPGCEFDVLRAARQG